MLQVSKPEEHPEELNFHYWGGRGKILCSGNEVGKEVLHLNLGVMRTLVSGLETRLTSDINHTRSTCS